MLSTQITRVFTHWSPITQWKYLCVSLGMQWTGSNKQVWGTSTQRYCTYYHWSCCSVQKAKVSKLLCCNSSALNTLENIFCSKIIESPKDRELYKHFDFLDDSVPRQPPASGLNGLAHSREKQTACQSPAEKQFSLVTYRTVTGSWCLQVCILDYQPLLVWKDLQQNNLTLPKRACSSSGIGCLSKATMTQNTDLPT